MVYHGSVKNSSNLMITNSRHKDALFKAYESINDAISAIEQRMPYDFIEVDFKNIWDYLGYINGDTVREDLLDTIFANQKMIYGDDPEMRWFTNNTGVEITKKGNKNQLKLKNKFYNHLRIDKSLSGFLFQL